MHASYSTDVPNLEEISQCTHTASVDRNPAIATFDLVLDNQNIARILHRVDMFRNGMRDGTNGDLVLFWMSYVDMVS